MVELSLWAGILGRGILMGIINLSQVSSASHSPTEPLMIDLQYVLMYILMCISLFPSHRISILHNVIIYNVSNCTYLIQVTI